MEARNIAQQYAIFFCVTLGDSVTTTHGKLQQAFGSLLKMSSAADDHQQHGQVTTQHEFENLFDPIED